MLYFLHFSDKTMLGKQKNQKVKYFTARKKQGCNTMLHVDMVRHPLQAERKGIEDSGPWPLQEEAGGSDKYVSRIL